MSRKKDDTYRVGYAKPPLHTRFKKGQSGNPAGRPQGIQNIGLAVSAELSKPVLTRRGDKRSKVTRRELNILQVVNKALRGDVRALAFILRRARAAEPKMPQYVIKYKVINDKR
jgi:hypothetical protein